MVRVSVIAVAMAVTLAVAGLLASATPSKAVEWPWCLDMYDGGRGGGTATNCGFANLRQCEATLSGMRGWCYPNPRYGDERPRRRGAHRN